MASRGVGAAQQMFIQSHGTLQCSSAFRWIPCPLLFPVSSPVTSVEPAHPHRGQRHLLPAVLPAAVGEVEPHTLHGTRSFLQLLCFI